MKNHSSICQFTTQKTYLPKNETPPSIFLAFEVNSSKSLFLEFFSALSQNNRSRISIGHFRPQKFIMSISQLPTVFIQLLSLPTDYFQFPAEIEHNQLSETTEDITFNSFTALDNFDSDSNRIRTHNHLVRRQTLNHLAKLFHLCRNQVAGFYQQNVCKTHVEE